MTLRFSQWAGIFVVALSFAAGPVVAGPSGFSRNLPVDRGAANLPVIPVVAGDLLTTEQLETNLKSLEGWKLREDGKAIEKSFEFENFSEAFGFMARVALEAEKLDHHPTWSNVYKKVDILLNSFTKNGVTDLDIELAQRIEKIVADK